MALGPPVTTLPDVVAQALAAIAIGLLAASGIAKLVDPAPTTGAMSAAGLPASRSVSYLLGALEVVASSLALIVGGMTALPAALLYLGFAIFTFAATRKRIPVQSCGCFGREDTPPSYLHVFFNVVAAVSLFALAPLGLAAVDWSLPIDELLLFVVFGAVGTYVSFLLLSQLPRLLALARS